MSGTENGKAEARMNRHSVKFVPRLCLVRAAKIAERLGINRNTLHKKISDYQLESKAR